MRPSFCDGMIIILILKMCVYAVLRALEPEEIRCNVNVGIYRNLKRF